MIIEINSLNEFDRVTENQCIEHFVALRWKAGVICPHCGSANAPYELKAVGHYKCVEKECNKKFSWRHGSIFADSPIKLKVWYKAIFLMTSHKKGIYSCQLARDLGVTQKTGWFILQRIRNASNTEEFNRPLDGEIECDEMFIGGQGKWMHKNKKTHLKTGGHSKKPVLGMQQRGGDLRLFPLSAVNLKEMRPILAANITYGSVVHTDEGAQYKWMGNHYAHALVKHYLGEYVRGDVTTNRIELAFGHFKRSVHGVYHKVSDGHLHRYLNMFSWRWNRKEMGEGERVNAMLVQTKNRQITYKQLTGKA